MLIEIAIELRQGSFMARQARTGIPPGRWTGYVCKLGSCMQIRGFLGLLPLVDPLYANELLQLYCLVSYFNSEVILLIFVVQNNFLGVSYLSAINNI